MTNNELSIIISEIRRKIRELQAVLDLTKESETLFHAYNYTINVLNEILYKAEVLYDK